MIVACESTITYSFIIISKIKAKKEKKKEIHRKEDKNIKKKKICGFHLRSWEKNKIKQKKKLFDFET